MNIENKYIELIQQYLDEKGIADPDIQMELKDHLCELMSQEQIDNELIPADILTQVDQQFERSDFQSIYQELVTIKKKRLLGALQFYLSNIISKGKLMHAFLLLLVHRVIFFVLLPTIPKEVYAPFEIIALGFTVIFYLSIAAFFVLKAVRMVRA